MLVEITERAVASDNAKDAMIIRSECNFDCKRGRPLWSANAGRSCTDWSMTDECSIDFA